MSVFEKELSTEKTQVRSVFWRRIRRKQKCKKEIVARTEQEAQYVEKTLIKSLKDNTIIGESVRLKA